VFEALADFTASADFGVAAVWSVGAASVDGIFDAGYQAATQGAFAGVESARFTFTCSAADVPTAAHGQTMTINSVAYVIRGVHPDGTGMVLLDLQAP